MEIVRHSNAVYMELALDGKLNEYLHGIDEESYQQVELLIEQLKTGAGTHSSTVVKNKNIHSNKTLAFVIT